MTLSASALSPQDSTAAVTVPLVGAVVGVDVAVVVVSEDGGGGGNGGIVADAVVDAASDASSLIVVSIPRSVVMPMA